MNKSLKITVTFFIIAYAVSLILFFEDISHYIINAVNTCINVIIPSLYGFMVISGFIVSSGLYIYLSKPFRWISLHIFRIPEELFSVFLTSMFAGYPVGTKMVGDLYTSKLTDRTTAERMLGFCYMGGPAFFCGTAGIQIYSSIKAGIIIYCCTLSANLILALLSGIGHSVSHNAVRNTSFSLSSECFLESVYSGGKGILKICASIIFFASFIAITDASGMLLNIASVISKLSGFSCSDSVCIVKSAIEISNIGQISPKAENLPIITALLSFGGACVIFQTSGFIPNGLSTHNFYISRIISSILSYLCCKIVIYFIGANAIIPTMAYQFYNRQNSPIPSIFLLIMTILLLSNNFIAKSKKM